MTPYRLGGTPPWAKGWHPDSLPFLEKTFQKAWEYDLKNGTIAVGWAELGDTSRLSKDEFNQKFKEEYPDSKNVQSAVWRCYHEISEGDIILARRGRKKMIGIGTVTGEAFYDEEKGKERLGNPVALEKDPCINYPNFIPVKWEEKIEEFDRQVFGVATFQKIKNPTLIKIVEDYLKEIQR